MKKYTYHGERKTESYRIEFWNPVDDRPDATYFDVDVDDRTIPEIMTELLDLFYDFCEENDFGSPRIDNIEHDETIMGTPLVTVREIYHDETGCQHSKLPERHMWLNEIEDRAKNWSAIRDRWSITNIVVDEDWNIISAGGYSEERGLFCDQY